VTGRPRRCGWFDAAALRRSVQINGVSGLCITKLDVLDELETVRLCTGYRHGATVTDILPYGADAVAAASRLRGLPRLEAVDLRVRDWGSCRKRRAATSRG